MADPASASPMSADAGTPAAPRSAGPESGVPDDVRRPGARRYRTAAVLLLIQGVLMEGLVAVGALVLVALGIPQETVTGRADVFALPYLQDNLYGMMAMSGIFAALRITGAIALWRRRLWGLALSLMNCVVTMVLMIFLLPAGIADGLLSGGALVLILWAWLGRDDAGQPRLV